MKKAFDQTVRDLKREVNKKVLKVPSIEQKVLDATSNEPWGPHGSVLADIAQSTRNYHEYQMIMSVIWKRTNDTGKNWRHVYKALVVLEYLLAYGTERVIDDIREHAYQISTLSDFQYIDSSGRDQGNNVRKKSQSLVVLVNDKERMQEVRQKAAANRDKFRSNQTGSMYRPSSFSSPGYGDRYDDDRYEGRYRDEERNGYGWERDDDRYGRYGDSYNRDGDRYSRDNEDRYSRDGSRDDDYRGRSQSYDANHHGSRGRSADHDKITTEGDSQYSSRGSGAKADDHSQDGSTMGKKLDRKYSAQSFGAPPSYEDVVCSSQSPTYSDRDGDSSLASAPNASSPKDDSPGAKTVVSVPLPAPASPAAHASASTAASGPASTQLINKEVDGFDEFDPRGSFSAAPLPSNGTTLTSDVEIDLLGSLSESHSSNSFALLPAGQATGSDVDASANLNTGTTVAAPLPSSTINSQPFDDPFGDGLFRAVPSSNSFDTSSNHSQVAPSVRRDVPTESGGTFNDGGPPPTSTQLPQHESSTASQNVDILADILPPAPADFSYAQAAYPAAPGQPAPHGGLPQASQPAPQSGSSTMTVHNAPQNGFQPQTGQAAGFPTQLGPHSMSKGYALQSAEPVSETGFAGQALALTYQVRAGQASQMGFHSQGGSGQTSQLGFHTQAGFVQPNMSNANIYGNPYNSQSIPPGPPSAANSAPPSSTGLVAQNNFLSQSGLSNPVASQQGLYGISSSIVAPVSTNPSSAVVLQPGREKFETKSTVWADTLSRGLVNLNISGPNANPMADIGVDFDAINRKEKRMEKPTTPPVTSTVTMGKAMGSGSGIGRAGAGVLRPAPNPMIGPGMNMGMAAGPGAGIPMGGYGVNQPMGRGMGMGMGMSMPGNMGMGMNIVGMGQQPMNMQQPMGYPPGPAMPGGYNMGAGNYGQPPYGGGYR